MDTAPRYEIVVTYPVYDNRDAICGFKSYCREMVYGTIPGAVFGALDSDEETEVVIFDRVEDRRVTTREIDSAVARAHGLNSFDRSYCPSNSKDWWSDNIPF